MKWIHLSDLHLGKRLREVSLMEDQTYILGQIMTLIDTEQPDAVLICGDVYDKSVPTAEAVGLFDDFLWGLARRKVPTMVISGNHDSAERLAFGGRLMDPSGIHISPVYDGNVAPVVLEDRYGQVRFYMLPFLKPASVRRLDEADTVHSYTDAVKLAIDRMNIDPGARNVLLTHQFVAGAGTCESEELTVGGTDQVDASLFDDFDYVALGHLHSPQNVHSPKIRYCGTPLKYSFSEVDHVKSVTVVELEEKGSLKVRTLPLHPLRDLRRIRGSYEQIVSRDFYEGTAVEDYLRITLTDEIEIPEVMGRLRAIYPNVLWIDYDNSRTRADAQIGTADRPQERPPEELFGELFALQNNHPMTEEQYALVTELIRQIREEQQ